jgi:SAM-dependent methyltransferase
MQADIIPLLCCPVDGSRLQLEGPAQDNYVREGAFVCLAHHHRYSIHDGVSYLYVDDKEWQPKAREAAGWVQLFRDTGGYIDDPDDYTMPHVGRPPWNEIAPQFDLALELASLVPGKRVLDLGAGRGWAARHFARQGCITVAVDVVGDPLVGVGRSLTLAAHDGSRITPLVADGENLPITSGSFDVVFCAATLHHATNLHRLLTNIKRVLRPGGVLIAINEPVIPDTVTERDALLEKDTVRELSYGINETRPHLDDYRQALRRAGLRERSIFPWQVYRIGLEDMRTWAGQLGVSDPLELSNNRGRSLFHWLRRKTPIDDLARLRQAWGEHVFRKLGGAAIIFAERPT